MCLNVMGVCICKNRVSSTFRVRKTMRTIERARWLLSRDPHGPSVRVLQKLLHALETKGDFNIAELAVLPHDRYQLAVDVMRDWRADQYHLPLLAPCGRGQGAAACACHDDKALEAEAALA